MSRTKNAAELCTLLVEDMYGELTYRIFTLLLRRGRQSVPEISQQTRLPSRHILHGLAVLIQQNLIYYQVEHDPEKTYYEANQDASYFLLRSGKIIEYVHARYGPPAQDIIQNLLSLGHAKIGDLLEACKQKPPPNKVYINGDEEAESITNGIHNGSDTCAVCPVQDKLLDTVINLLESGLIVPAKRTMHQSPSDLYDQVEREVLSIHFPSGTKGTKQKDEAKAKIIEKLQDIRSESETWQRKGKKRVLNGVYANGSGKRRKLTNGVGVVDRESHTHHSESERVDHDLVVTINYEKCTVALRSQYFVSLAARRIGETTSHVYATLLGLLEDRVPRCQLNPAIDNLSDISDGPTVTTMDLARALNKSIDPSTGIGKVDRKSVYTTALEKSQKKRKRKFNESEATVDGEASSDEDEDDEDASNHINANGNINEVEQDSDSLGEDSFPDPFANAPAVQPPRRATRVTFDDELPRQDTRDVKLNRAMDIKNHLLLLSEFTPRLVRKCGSSGLGEWTVDFDEIVKSVQEDEINSIIGQRFGVLGSRIVEILKQKGRLEEKQIQKYGLLKMKNIRNKLVEMQMAGFADIQDVPKDNAHTALRTVFLWFFDPERVKAIALDNIYKTMTRCLQVLKAEKHEERYILTQVERSDIKGKEEEFLPKDRLDRLYLIRDKEKQIFTQLGRLDDMVSVFKDF